MTGSIQIRSAGPDDADALSWTIAESFHALAPSVWLIPDEAARREIFPGYFHLLVDGALARGRVDMTIDRTAAALWFPIGPDPGPAPDDYDAQLETLTGRWVDRFRLFDTTLSKHHPVGIRHDHLAILAVHPDHQHQGLGTALLISHHARLDHADPPTAAYLEASDTTTRDLYLRHGYTLMPDGPILLPDGHAMWPMWRQPLSFASQSPDSSIAAAPRPPLR